MIDVTSGATSGEVEFTVQWPSREQVVAPEAPATKFTIEIQHDTIALLEKITEVIQDLISPLFEITVDTFQSLHSLALEDQRILLEFSTGVLVINWIVSYALFPLMEAYLSLVSEAESSLLLPSRLLSEVMDILNMTIADLGSMANIDTGDQTVSLPRDETAFGEIGINSSISSPSDFTLFGIKILGSISPPAFMIVGPLTVMILTCIIADNKYYLFATLFAPMVDRVLSSTRSLFAHITPNYHEDQNRTIPDGEETYDGVLWGMLVLFCLEGLLVGSIVVLMVMISVVLTSFASLSASLSPKENSEILEELSKILVGFLLTWVGCVLTTNILRMVLYQTVDDND